MNKIEQINAVCERINAARFALRSTAFIKDREQRKTASHEHMLTLECERMNLRALREN